ncbi:nck-associated protein 5 [Nesidiocoris tenuis]|uniref:Nck-associated protein 5 n=1 Tax=Nesidiocoris tenuis TaxID=355587 RepID=A0ABN7BE13_9HEMI|nr:nck-associated protein 5 [Nesidiocoris tenuis]
MHNFESELQPTNESLRNGPPQVFWQSVGKVFPSEAAGPSSLQSPEHRPGDTHGMGTNASKSAKREALCREVTLLPAVKAKDSPSPKDFSPQGLKGSLKDDLKDQDAKDHISERYEPTKSPQEGSAGRLHALQQTVTNLEDSLRSMSSYKAQNSLLLAENENLKTSIKDKTAQFQSDIDRLKTENEELRSRLHATELASSQREAELWRWLRATEEENNRLTAEREKCEKCLDQVAHGVVRTLLSQKGLSEEISTLRKKVKELDKQNYALSSLLLHNVPKGRPSMRTTWDVVIRPLSCDDGRVYGSRKDEQLPAVTGNFLWTPAHRPSSLNLELRSSILASFSGECQKDEGYSTMSSEVLGESVPCRSSGALERLQEETTCRSCDPCKFSTFPRSSSDSSLLAPFCPGQLSDSMSLPRCLPTALGAVSDGHGGWWEPMGEPVDDAVPPPPELEDWNMDDIFGLSLVDLEDEEDVWSAVDSWSSGRTTASSSFGVSNATGNAYMASKRSSGADSAATGVSITTPGDVDGIGTTSFTRDFYRLVKFESNKSLASSSSKSQVSEPGAVRDGSAQNQQLASLQSGDDAKESDSEQLSLSDRSTSAITQLSCQEVINCPSPAVPTSEEQQPVIVRTSESWGLLTVPEEEAENSDGGTDKNDRADSIAVAGRKEEISPLRAANTLAELEQIVTAAGLDEEEDEKKEIDAESADVSREWRPTGWIHLPRAEFGDLKMRANYAELVFHTSRSSSSCSGSSESSDDHSPYQQLRRLHRSRRHKKASASRDGAVRIHLTPRFSIVGREDIFTRFGAKEAEAVASFDFLEELESENLASPR